MGFWVWWPDLVWDFLGFGFFGLVVCVVVGVSFGLGLLQHGFDIMALIWCFIYCGGCSGGGGGCGNDHVVVAMRERERERERRLKEVIKNNEKWILYY